MPIADQKQRELAIAIEAIDSSVNTNETLSTAAKQVSSALKTMQKSPLTEEDADLMLLVANNTLALVQKNNPETKQKALLALTHILDTLNSPDHPQNTVLSKPVVGLLCAGWMLCCLALVAVAYFASATNLFTVDLSFASIGIPPPILTLGYKLGSIPYHAMFPNVVQAAQKAILASAGKAAQQAILSHHTQQEMQHKTQDLKGALKTLVGKSQEEVISKSKQPARTESNLKPFKQ